MRNRSRYYKILNEKYLFSESELGQMFGVTRQSISYVILNQNPKKSNTDIERCQLPDKYKNVTKNLIVNEGNCQIEMVDDCTYRFYLCESYNAEEVCIFFMKYTGDTLVNVCLYELPKELKDLYINTYEGYRKEDYSVRVKSLKYIEKCKENFLTPRLGKLSELGKYHTLAFKYVRHALGDTTISRNDALKPYTLYLTGYNFDVTVVDEVSLINRVLPEEVLETKVIEDGIANKRYYKPLVEFIKENKLDISPTELLERNGFVVKSRKKVVSVLSDKWIWLRKMFLLKYFGVKGDTIYLPVDNKFYKNFSYILNTHNVSLDEFCKLAGLQRLTKGDLPSDYTPPETYPTRLDRKLLRELEIEYLLEKLVDEEGVLKVYSKDSDIVRLRLLLNLENSSLQELLDKKNYKRTKLDNLPIKYEEFKEKIQSIERELGISTSK